MRRPHWHLWTTLYDSLDSHPTKDRSWVPIGSFHFQTILMGDFVFTKLEGRYFLPKHEIQPILYQTHLSPANPKHYDRDDQRNRELTRRSSYHLFREPNTKRLPKRRCSFLQTANLLYLEDWLRLGWSCTGWWYWWSGQRTDYIDFLFVGIQHVRWCHYSLCV